MPTSSSKFNDHAPSNLVRLCPKCGSGDVSWCTMSVRPYCNECNWWAPVNMGSPTDAVILWNESVRKAGV